MVGNERERYGDPCSWPCYPARRAYRVRHQPLQIGASEISLTGPACLFLQQVSFKSQRDPRSRLPQPSKLEKKDLQLILTIPRVQDHVPLSQGEGLR